MIGSVVAWFGKTARVRVGILVARGHQVMKIVRRGAFPVNSQQMKKDRL